MLDHRRLKPYGPLTGLTLSFKVLKSFAYLVYVYNRIFYPWRRHHCGPPCRPLVNLLLANTRFDAVCAIWLNRYILTSPCAYGRTKMEGVRKNLQCGATNSGTNVGLIKVGVKVSRSDYESCETVPFLNRRTTVLPLFWWHRRHRLYGIVLWRIEPLLRRDLETNNEHTLVDPLERGNFNHWTTYVRVRVTLRLAAYRHSVRLGDKPL
jgi:hypothetical protein